MTSPLVLPGQPVDADSRVHVPLYVRVGRGREPGRRSILQRTTDVAIGHRP